MPADADDFYKDLMSATVTKGHDLMTRKHFFSLVVASDGQFDILHLPPSRQCAIDCQCQRSLFSIRIYTVKHKNRIFYF